MYTGTDYSTRGPFHRSNYCEGTTTVVRPTHTAGSSESQRSLIEMGKTHEAGLKRAGRPEPPGARSRRTGGRRLRELRAEAGADERRRLVEALHDGPLQMATAAKIRLQARRQGVRDRTAAKSLAEAIALIGQAIAAMRALLRDPAQPSGSGSLQVRLRRAAGRWGEVTGVRVHLSFLGTARASAFSRETVEVAEHVVSESIVNAWKHGRATRVSVGCERDRGGLLLTLQDNGRGFRASIAPEPRNGTRMGLRLLRSRVGELGGWFDARSSPGGGAVVQAWLPPRPASHREPE